MSLQAGCPRIWRMRPRLRLSATLYPQAERVSAARSASPSGGPDRTGRVSAWRSQRLRVSDYTPISAERPTNRSANQDATRTRNGRINPQTVRTHADASDKNKGSPQVGLARPKLPNNPKPADIKNDRPTSSKGNAHAHPGDRPGKRGRVRS